MTELEKTCSMIGVEVAAALNELAKGSDAPLQDIGYSIDLVMPDGFSPEEKHQALERAKVYAFNNHLPGCVPDAAPIFLPGDSDVREHIASELDYLRDGRDDNTEQWLELKEDVRNSDISRFQGSFSIDLPNGYIMEASLMDCGAALKGNGIELDFEQEAFSPMP